MLDVKLLMSASVGLLPHMYFDKTNSTLWLLISWRYGHSFTSLNWTELHNPDTLLGRLFVRLQNEMVILLFSLHLFSCLCLSLMKKTFFWKCCRTCEQPRLGLNVWDELTAWHLISSRGCECLDSLLSCHESSLDSVFSAEAHEFLLSHSIYAHKIMVSIENNAV